MSPKRNSKFVLALESSPSALALFIVAIGGVWQSAEAHRGPTYWATAARYAVLIWGVATNSRIIRLPGRIGCSALWDNSSLPGRCALNARALFPARRSAIWLTL